MVHGIRDKLSGMKSFKTTFMKYRRLLVWVVSIVILYTLIGFLLVPWLAERQLVKITQERLDAETSVEKITFNPFTFEASVDTLQLSNRQGESLVAWDKLYINLQPLHLFLLNIRFEEITIDKPALHFQRYSESENTLTHLAESWNASAEGEPEDTTEQAETSESGDPLFAMEIGDFNYNDGQLAYRDDVPETQFETVLSPINIHLDDFSTAAGETASQDLIIVLENDAKLTLNGSMVLSPLQFAGQVDLENFSLQTPYRYLKAQLPFELQEGRLDLQLDYDADLADTANVELKEINVDLSGFSLHQPGESSALLQGGTLTASNGRFVFPDNQLRIDDVSLKDFQLAASRNSEGELDWLQLFEPMLAGDSEDKPAESEASPLQLDIANLEIANTTLSLADQQPESPVNLELMLSADMQDFSLTDDQQMPFSTQVNLESGGDITLDGQLQISPTLAVQAETGIEQLSLLPIQPYLNQYADIEMVSGKIDSAASITSNQQELFSIQGDLTLSEMQLDNQQLDEKLIGLEQLAFSSFAFSQANQKLAISDVVVDALYSRVVINEDGETNLAMLIKAQDDKASDGESSAEQSSPLQFDIANLQINNAELSLADQQPESPVNLGLMLSADMQDFSLADDQQMPFSTQVSLDSGGEITAEGELQLFPALALTAETGVKQLSLLPVQTYLNQYAHIELVSGKVDSTAKVTTDQQEPFAITGDLTLSEMQLDNQKLDEKLLGLDSLAVNSLDFSQAEQRVAISEVIVDALYSRVLINENGETNLGLLLKEQSTSDSGEADTEKSDSLNDYDFSLGRVKINDASSRFTDQNLPIVFNAHMQTLNGEISGFSTRSKQPVDIALEGQVDEFGLVEISGEMNPLDVTSQTTIKLAFSNLGLPAMSPYTVKFAGREIAEGKGDIDLTYEVVESQLDASNDIVIRDIRLGERVESPDAMDLPLDLAVSLLKNSDGVIALNIPVSGDVNDPDFAMGPVIRGAIGSALKNVATAPFRFLGSLVGLGSDDKPIDEVRFRAGRADLAPPEQEKLLKLVDALSQRPQLALQIPAPFNESTDEQGLKAAAVEARIETRMEEIDSSAQRDQKRRQVLEELYQQAELGPDLSVLEREFTTQGDSDEQTESQLDLLAYNDSLEERLIEAESVSETQLHDLARQRQQAVVDYVNENGELDDEQLQTTDRVTAEVDDGWLSMQFDLETL